MLLSIIINYKSKLSSINHSIASLVTLWIPSIPCLNNLLGHDSTMCFMVCSTSPQSHATLSLQRHLNNKNPHLP